jgi:hypothetical protein
MDTFDPKDFGPQETQRMATMLLYLSEVEEGGETVFKKEGEDGRHALQCCLLPWVFPPVCVYSAHNHPYCA